MYVRTTYMKKPLILSIRCKGRGPFVTISFNSSSRHFVLSHFSRDTIPTRRPEPVWVTVPAQGPGDSVGDVHFLDASWIPLLEQPDP